MKSIWKKSLFSIPIFAVTFAAMSMSALASSKINSVSIKFTVNGYDDSGMPEIEASTGGSHYSVGSVELEDTYDDSDADIDYSSAKYSVDLSADDDYVFYITKASQVRLNGGGATYVKASRQDSGTTLHVVVKFENLEEFCGDIAEVTWDNDGNLSWQSAQNAKQYKITVYHKDHVTAGTAYTGGTRYDCKPFMLREGEYSARVTPETKSKKGSTVKAETVTISAEQAAANSAKYALRKEYITTGESEGPSSTTYNVLNAGWKQAGDKWWYQNTGGDYIQYNWLQEGNAWYFFDSDGYMVTNSAVAWNGAKYYFDANGKMVTNATIPDGRKAGADGALSGKATDVSKVTNLYFDSTSAVGPAFAQN